MRIALGTALILTCIAVSARGRNERRHNLADCTDLKHACEKAGYQRGAHGSGKGLFRDCMDKVAEGHKMAGVAIEPSHPSVQKCKAAMDAASAEDEVGQQKSAKSTESHNKTRKQQEGRH